MLNMKQWHLVDLFRAGFRLKQDQTPQGLTVSVDKTFLESIASQFAGERGWSKNLAEVVETAIFCQPGMTLRRAASDKEIYIDITGQ
jgi:hypothetical protein